MRTEPNKVRLYDYRSFLLHIMQFCIDQLAKIFPKKKVFLQKIPIRKIIVIKPDHIGDSFICGLVVKKLRGKFERVDAILSPDSLALAKACNFYDNVYIVNHFMHNRDAKFYTRLKTFLTDYLRAYRLLKANQYDVALLMRSAPGNLVTLAYFSGVKYIVGSLKGGLYALLNKAVAPPSTESHESDYQSSIARVLDPSLKVDYKIARLKKRNVKFLDLISPEDLLLLPNAGNLSKELECLDWVNFLPRDNRKVIICGTKDNSQLEGTLKAYGYDILNLTNLLDFEGLLCAMSKVKITYCVDSFPCHYSAAVGNETYVFIKKNSNYFRWRAIGRNVIYASVI
jgi:ADP-heptose:LPS heptosyltransferase